MALGSCHSVKILWQLALLHIPQQRMWKVVKSCKIGHRLAEWGSTEPIVKKVVDTTANNTSHLTAACVTMKHLEPALLWSGCCRQHRNGTIWRRPVSSFCRWAANNVLFLTLKNLSFSLRAHTTNGWKILSKRDETKFSHDLYCCRVKISIYTVAK